MALVQLQGGGFQDIEGKPLANGYLFFRLSAPAVDATATIAICNEWVLRVPLDANGNIIGGNNASFIWPTDQLFPWPVSNEEPLYYLVWAESQYGDLSWGPNSVTITGSSPFNVGNWVPSNPS